MAQRYVHVPKSKFEIEPAMSDDTARGILEQAGRLPVADLLGRRGYAVPYPVQVRQGYKSYKIPYLNIKYHEPWEARKEKTFIEPLVAIQLQHVVEHALFTLPPRQQAYESKVLAKLLLRDLVSAKPDTDWEQPWLRHLLCIGGISTHIGEQLTVVHQFVKKAVNFKRNGILLRHQHRSHLLLVVADVDAADVFAQLRTRFPWVGITVERYGGLSTDTHYGGLLFTEDGKWVGLGKDRLDYEPLIRDPEEVAAIAQRVHTHHRLRKLHALLPDPV